MPACAVGIVSWKHAAKVCTFCFNPNEYHRGYSPVARDVVETVPRHSRLANEGCTETVVSSMENLPKKSASKSASKPHLVGVKLS